MSDLHHYLVVVHIAIGAVALVLFWVPVLTRKGSPLHRRVGRWYVTAMTLVSISAIASSLMVLADPIGIRQPDATLSAERIEELAMLYRSMSLFLLMLGVLVFVSLRHGIMALQARNQPDLLRQPAHRALIVLLGVLGLAVGIIGIVLSQLLLIIFAVISVTAAIGSWRDGGLNMSEHRNRIIAHLSSIIGTGIGAYTAFFAFGGARFLREWLPGQWQVIPWVLPAIIGTVFITRWKRQYQRPVSAENAR